MIVYFLLFYSGVVSSQGIGSFSYPLRRQCKCDQTQNLFWKRFTLFCTDGFFYNYNGPIDKPHSCAECTSEPENN